MFGYFPVMRVLALQWPAEFEHNGWPDKIKKVEFRRGVKSLLVQCMPSDGQALLHLETILITAHSMQGTFPAAS